MDQKRSKRPTTASERRAKAALGLGPGKLRYTPAESQVTLGIGNTKFWALKKAGRIEVHYDGNRAYCTHQTLEKYVQDSRANTTPPPYKPAAKPGTKGVQAPAAKPEGA